MSKDYRLVKETLGARPVFYYTQTREADGEWEIVVGSGAHQEDVAHEHYKRITSGVTLTVEILASTVKEPQP